MNALAIVVLLGGTMLLMGFTGSMQVSATCEMMERTHAYRTIDLAADSAFEEASALLEQRFQDLDFPASRQRRDLGASLTWPAELETPVTRRSFEGHGVTLSAVSIRSSPWVMFQALTPEYARVCQERGILELQVVAGVRGLTRRVIARRYMSLEPPPSGDRARLMVQGINIYRELKS